MIKIEPSFFLNILCITVRVGIRRFFAIYLVIYLSIYLFICLFYLFTLEQNTISKMVLCMLIQLNYKE